MNGLTLVPPSDCSRAREWASLGLDEELSELQQAFVRSHLGGCADCRRFAAGLEAVARELRAAPLAQPEATLALPERRRERKRALRLRVPAAAAAVAVAVGVGSLAGALTSGGSRAPRTASDAAALHAEYAEQQLMAMLLQDVGPSKLRVGKTVAT